MKTILRISFLFAAVVIAGTTVAQAQRILKGTVYMDGEPAAGVTVEAHKGGDGMMTSFDGKYEVEADEKSKYINFTFINEKKKLDIEDKSGDVFDFAFTGSIPSGDAGADEDGEVNLKTLEELQQAGNRDFLNEYSMFDTFYRNGEYNSAKPSWEKLYNKYPKSSVNLYIRGGTMYEKEINSAKTDAERDKILDQYMKLYDKRIEYFGERGKNLGRKGASWLEYKLHENRDERAEGDALIKIHKSAYEWLSESVELEGNDSEPAVILIYMQTTIALFKLGELPKETVVSNYEKAMGIANAIIEANKDEAKVKDTRETVVPYIEERFGKSGAADCEALISIYSPQYQENIDDAEFIKEILRRLGTAKCTESELFATATERLYELDPSAEAAFNMARRYLRKGDVDRAREYYQMAIDQETDPKLKATYHYERGLIRLSDGNYVGARNDARLALQMDPDLCDVNLLIGNIYVAASQKFEGSDLQKKAVFWLASDYYEKARRGEDCSIEAAGFLRDYKKHFPKKEDAFMEGLQEGDTYHVGGWINENTKVRF
ncbi:MAG TPA: tetratricopeptide repeat protein [Draconibacterium sp.]|nr:tetratricopeptide repeat protein [Draconibacterium sp.]